MPFELNTPDELKYNFFPVGNGVVHFMVRAANDAHVCLTAGPEETEPIVEVFLGGWGNTKSVIRRNRTKPEKAEADTPEILTPGEFRGFWIKWMDGVITVGHEGGVAAFLSWSDPEPFHITHVGVCTGWGAAGSWKIEEPGTAAAFTAAVGAGGVPCWVPAEGGNVPDGAVPAGQDGEQLFVARARHDGALIPGKLVPSHGCAYVSCGGGEHSHPEYEVLCGCSGTWMPVTGASIPPNAVPAGENSDGEPLFVGRANHEGTLTPGKVQESHGVCYIPYGGEELAFQEYEIFCSN